MNIEFIDVEDYKIKMIISKSDPAMVNALRRTLIADIPKLAIDDVEFHLGSISDESDKEYESITPIFDEIIAHRLGMLPIPTDLEKFNFRDECTCKGEGCPSCMVMYVLNKKGPCVVYSGDLEPLGDDPSLAIKDDLIPIVKLAKGQAPLIYATAVLGTGRQHAKWQVAHAVGYNYYVSIRINERKCKKCKKCVKMCPRDVIVFEKDKVVAKTIHDCILCKTCVEVCDAGAINLKWDDKKFVFQFETDKSMTALTALKYAFKILSNKLYELREKVGGLEE